MKLDQVKRLKVLEQENNTVRPHSAMGYQPPASEDVLLGTLTPPGNPGPPGSPPQSATMLQ